jgi:hypothetical protein
MPALVRTRTDEQTADVIRARLDALEASIARGVPRRRGPLRRPARRGAGSLNARMAGTIAVEADFEADLRDHCAAELANLGIPVPSSQDVERVCVAFFNARRRLIPVQRRQVLTSRELGARVFDVRYRDALRHIADEASRGADLRPRLSRRLLNPEYNDPLLNDWGIRSASNVKSTSASSTDCCT